jgi:uncharacterized protein (TIGR00251 family)
VPAPTSGGRGTLLEIKVAPGASRSRIVGPHGDGWRVQIAAPPERGRANDALVELLAETLGVPRRAVSVVRGATSARKTVRIEGLSPAEVERRLVP